MKKTLLLLILMSFPALLWAEPPSVSTESRACIDCHRTYTPGIVEDWLTSRHSKITPAEAMRKPELERRVSARSLDESLGNQAVGCFECHGRSPGAHKDNFEHFGFRINVVVSPKDCAACHPVEEEQYRDSKKGNAYANLNNNAVYHTLYSTIIGLKTVSDTTIFTQKPSDMMRRDTCFACHGMPVTVRGMKEIDTEMGKITVPDLANWPNMGVGRLNPDGSRGACTSCHPRHSFSIETARKPYTCSQCHLEPDVPAWNVYSESKHGNILLSRHEGWNFTNVPWTPGRDFLAPSCSTCHNSLLVSSEGKVIAERSHDFGSKLWVRLFGLIYSHPQPRHGDTTAIKNKDGLPLPTTFTGEPASKFLIDGAEQERRMAMMKSVCGACHGSDWVDGHFEKMDNTIKETDQMVLASTRLLLEAWEAGIADKTNPFDEGIEQDWIRQWLFYANSAKYASAMTGAPDYVAFKYGWWEMTGNLRKMKETIDLKKKVAVAKPEQPKEPEKKPDAKKKAATKRR